MNVFGAVRSVSRSVVQVVTLCAACAAGGSPTWAGFVTTNEAGLDAIFSQASFTDPVTRADEKIDIRFNPAVTLSAPDLRAIDSEAKLDRLFRLAPDNVPTVQMFFVDSIDVCGGGVLHGAIGCGQLPGNELTIESATAAGVLGPALLAHELGHNLGLDHSSSSANLMARVLNGNTTLTRDQVLTILGSPLVQLDPQMNRFILVTPFAIVPEPSTMIFAFAGMLLLLRVRRQAGPA